MSLTPTSLALFIAYANDAGNWNGSPCIGGNVSIGSEKQDRGNLTQLKKAGLITTDGQYVDFTDAGIAFAAEQGVDISWIKEGK